MFWLGFGGCDTLTTLCLSPWSFLLKTSWIGMRREGFSPLVSQEPMFKVLAQSYEAIQSYWPSSVGFECGH